MAELFDQQFRRVLINRLVDGDHHVEIEQLFHQVSALLAHTLGEFGNGDDFRHHNIADLLFAWRR